MEYRKLGGTGVEVSSLCLGAMMFGAWGNPDHEDSIRIIHRALDAGINFVDTADVYSRGESETIVGKALKDRRDGVVLATKAHGPMGDDPNERGNSRRWLIQECEASLRRLGTDWIDLYQIHRWDPHTDHDETLGALTDLVRAGKVRYIGSSTYPPSSIVAAQWTAERRGRERFVCEQPPYSMLVRGVEAEVLPICQEYGMGVISWSPLAGGWLTGRWRKGQEPPPSTRAQRIPQRYDLSLPENQRKLELDLVAVLVNQHGGLSVSNRLEWIHLAPAQRRVGDGGRCPAGVGQGEGRARRDDLVDPVEHGRVQPNVDRTELGLELLHRARPDDRGCHRRMVEHEGDGHVDERQVRRVGELCKSVGRIKLALVFG